MTEEPTLHLPVSTLRHALEQACAIYEEYRDPAHFADQSQARKHAAQIVLAEILQPLRPADLQQPEPDADAGSAADASAAADAITPRAVQLAGICVAAGIEYPDLEESCSARGIDPDTAELDQIRAAVMADYPPASTH
jgi:hypothetical protein